VFISEMLRQYFQPKWVQIRHRELSKINAIQPSHA
jgi:hypothetical protein